MNIQGLPMMARYIHAVLLVIVFIRGPLTAELPYIHGPVRIAGIAYIHAVLLVIVFIRRPLTAGLPYIHGPVRMAGVAYIHGRLPTLQDLVKTTSERTWPLLT